MNDFQKAIKTGIPSDLPLVRTYDDNVNHAPRRKDILNRQEKKQALINALRYFPVEFHSELAHEFYRELEDYGRIYMYRFRPSYEMFARPIDEYPANCRTAAAVMLMIQNNLDPRVAQHPHELITYGGNGAVFQNWAQYLITMKYLSQMSDEQTLHMYSGHPLGLFPSPKSGPRVIVTNGMMIPNYSSPDDWERFNAMGVTQYGQMTAGSYMYIGPQGIVHGTTITLLNAIRKLRGENPGGMLFVSSGLGGMSGAQPKAANIAGLVSVTAEVNPKALAIRHGQAWVDEVIENLPDLAHRVQKAKDQGETVSIAYAGNIVDVWEYFDKEGIIIDIGSDQTSLHNPYSGGYYPVGVSFEESNQMMAAEPGKFKKLVRESLLRHADSVISQAKKGTYFFDYGNAFLLEAGRAGAPIINKEGNYIFPSYVQDIMGPMCFDYGFGPFRWVCTSGNPEDLAKTDAIALDVLRKLSSKAPEDTRQQMEDNIRWIEEAGMNNLVVGSQARILYADSPGRIQIAEAFNKAIRDGHIGPVVLGRDHHDVSGTDSPFRETSNIYDGSRFTADMAIQNVIGDSFRGASWVSIHNGGGVGWGEVINGGFGLLLDGSEEADHRLRQMLYFDVNNGIARRNWAGNSGSQRAIQRAMDENSDLTITIPNRADQGLIDDIFS